MKVTDSILGKRPSGGLLLFFLLLVISNYSLADELVLKSGKVLKGVILEEGAEYVVFREQGGGNTLTYNKALLEAIKREDTQLGVSVSDILQRISALQQNRQWDAAINLLLDTVSRAPQNATALSEVFQALLFQLDAEARNARTKDLGRARELYRTAYRTFQSSSTQLLLSSQKSFDEARRSYAQALAAVDYDLAIQLARTPGMAPQLQALLEEAIALDPTLVNAYLFLGNLAFAQRDYQKAIRAYRTVLSSKGLTDEQTSQAREGLRLAEFRQQQEAARTPVPILSPTPSVASQQIAATTPEPANKLTRLVKQAEERLEAIGVMGYIRPLWREISSGQYNTYFVAVPSIILFLWLIPFWFLKWRSRRGDIVAAELREFTKRAGILGVIRYFVRIGKSAKPKNRCPFCNKTLDKLESYTDLNFYACPHCHEPITPIYDLKDYIDHLVKQLELQLKHSKENVTMGIERDLMLKLVRAVITLAKRKRASDLHVESDLEGANLRVRVDGMMYDFLSLPKSVSLAFISALKIMANLDITERRVPQDGKFSMWIDKADVDLRINTSPAALGEKVSIRILDQKAISVDPQKLGLDGENLERFERAIFRPHGMIIVTGPAGSGKSTTLYVALNQLNTGEKNIVTLEDPIEYQIKGISQMQVNPATGFTFASGLRSILRQDADVIMVGEIRDSETADIAVEAALTGHLLLTTLHTIDAPTAFARMADLGVDVSRMASALICIIAQRLVRTICSHCVKPYKPKKSQLDALNITEVPKDFVFVHGTGCDECMNTGYCGRIGLFEFLMPDEQMREVLESGPPVSVIRELARKKGFASLRDEGLRKVYAGITTVDEVVRVIS